MPDKILGWITDEITGVPDAVFVHSKRFMASAKSKEGALKLAKMALDSWLSNSH